MTTLADPIDPLLVLWDRPGLGWWVRRVTATFFLLPAMMSALLAATSAEVEIGWVLLGLGALLGILCVAWGLYHRLFAQAIDHWGFGRRTFLQAFYIWITLTVFLIALGQWWEGICTAAEVAAPRHPYWGPGIANSFTLQASSLVGLIAAAEAIMALARGHRRFLVIREQAMRARLAPHFLFNTLNTLHAQIEEDPKGAQSTTENLGALFRHVLEISDKPTIPLRQELEFIGTYLGIEQARLGHRLQVAIDVPEALESADIPPLSLQVIVENAIKHGVAPLEQGGEVRIGAERRNDLLHLWVEDPGTGASPQKGTGTALETLRQRLERPEDLSMGMVGGRHRVGFQWRQA